MVEESQQRKRKSEANLYVVPFGRYNLSETMPLSMMKRLDEEVPPVFMILDTFDKGWMISKAISILHPASRKHQIMQQ